MESDEARVEEIDAEGVLGFAEFVLTNASRLWPEAEPDHKQKLQAVLFPEKITVGMASPPGPDGLQTPVERWIPAA